jgi:hypothetical protein
MPLSVEQLRHSRGTGRRSRRPLLGSVATALVLSVSACVPLNPSATALAGRWTVEWTCGLETLDLSADGTYTYKVTYEAGGQMTDAGRWKLIAKTGRLDGAHVVLQNALETCTWSGDRALSHVRDDRQLEAMWEWGRPTLLFDPDTQGFTR